jgi:hypothetical protein
VQITRLAAQESDHRHRRLLPPRSNRPRRLTTEQRGEIALPYSIISSARASTMGPRGRARLAKTKPTPTSAAIVKTIGTTVRLLCRDGCSFSVHDNDSNSATMSE